MAINPFCDKCGNELLDFGGILLSPPDKQSKVIKYHLCKECFTSFAATLKNPTQTND